MLSSSSRLNVLRSFDPPFDTSQSRFSTAWWVFVALAATLLPLMVFASFDFGVTWDEKPRHHYGELVWEFMRGLRARNTTYVEDGGHLYGGLFDTICAAVEQYVPVNRYVLRHAINAAFGWIGIVYVGRLAARLFGQWAGVLGLLLIAFSPRYFADSMNNPKDLPFAAATAAALYYFSTMSPRWPYLSRSTAFKIVLALAAALNIRAAALLYLGYFGLLIGAFVLAERQFDRRRLLDTFLRVVAVTAGVLVLGTVFWPWAMASPFVRPIEALLSFANAPFGADVLFNGRPVPSNDLPWYDVPVWLLISTPPVVLVGLVLAGLFTKREWLPALFALSAIALLPIALVIIQRSTLYDGVRHLLFIYPAIVVLAAAGWTAALSRRDPLVRRITAVLLVHRPRQHPHVHRSRPSQRVRIFQRARRRTEGRVFEIRHGLLGKLRAAGGRVECQDRTALGRSSGDLRRALAGDPARFRTISPAVVRAAVQKQAPARYSVGARFW